MGYKLTNGISTETELDQVGNGELLTVWTRGRYEQNIILMIIEDFGKAHTFLTMTEYFLNDHLL